MQTVHTASPNGEGLDQETYDFYRDVLAVLTESRTPFLIGGAYAFNHYTRINRCTKDLDIFLRREHFEQASAALQAAGYDTELTYPHWLGKIHHRGIFIDLIFSSGNGVAVVDDRWFEHADQTELLGFRCLLSPVEEMIWSKAFIMERERYDGADIAHLLLTCSEQLDWKRVMQRFTPHWRVLLSHLVLFGFIYPDQRQRIPPWVMEDLLHRLRAEMRSAAADEGVCQGTLLSREQFLNDIECQGLRDGRVVPLGNMTPQDAASWTEAIPDRGSD